MNEKLQDWKIRQHYEKEAVQKKIVNISQYREVVPSYENTYGRRPDTINFPGDLKDFVDNGALSFHGSVEKWQNPLLIDKTDNNDDLRTGWDLVIDIDCDESLELSKKTAHLVKDSLNRFGVNNIGLKFSGNRGFHLMVPEIAFPSKVNSKNLSNLYPKLPREIVNLIREDIEEKLIEEIKSEGFEDQIKTDNGYNPFLVADVENNWGDRHLFRLPYSIHEGSGLVSIPLKFEELEDFQRKDAKIDKVKADKSFIPDSENGECYNLVIQAMDRLSDKKQEIEQERKHTSEEFSLKDKDIEKEDFPPTILNILEGLEDGRKRALFILINFFDTLGFDWEKIENKIWDWNQRNEEPLSESYVNSQLRWHKSRNETVPPPNYDSDGYYKDINVYEGDHLEEKVSNPVAYVMKKSNANRENDQIHECPYCGKEFKNKGKYKEHVQTCFNE